MEFIGARQKSRFWWVKVVLNLTAELEYLSMHSLSSAVSGLTLNPIPYTLNPKSETLNPNDPIP